MLFGNPFLEPDSLPLANSEPAKNCALCPRLVDFRNECAAEYPDWWNAPVPAWGDKDAWLGIIGLAPGKHGANRTGRPFTGDYAGDLLFETFAKYGFSEGEYQARADDGVQLKGAIILNSVKCLPPQNKPTPQEVQNCRQFLTTQLAELQNLRVFIALGKIAHDSFIRHIGGKLADYKFGHGAQHQLPSGQILIDSYHCSRYNTQTGRLTPQMFGDVFQAAKNIR
ncbi:uracil-DNA glycosylase [Sphingorhabdus lutea]|uniref:Type-5 uracil-DNA glycosylase n=1 Tax=Sphingorhabdus lutea TaxID=1913578 RepID=A0A1L3JCM3_9SPHN|nr:uracil-DNA glycosylase [Sphingorhabdus lutea]APG62874.1 uracil-DNA glycosylase [Sphingorhabdus lutea]